MDQKSDVRLHAAEALGKLGNTSDEVVAALIKALGDKDSDVRLHATEALGNLGKASDNVVAALIKALGDYYSDISRSASRALRKILHIQNLRTAIIEACTSNNTDYLGALAKACVLLGIPVILEKEKFDEKYHKLIEKTFINELKKLKLPQHVNENKSIESKVEIVSTTTFKTQMNKKVTKPSLQNSSSADLHNKAEKLATAVAAVAVKLGEFKLIEAQKASLIKKLTSTFEGNTKILNIKDGTQCKSFVKDIAKAITTKKKALGILVNRVGSVTDAMAEWFEGNVVENQIEVKENNSITQSSSNNLGLLLEYSRSSSSNQYNNSAISISSHDENNTDKQCCVIL